MLIKLQMSLLFQRENKSTIYTTNNYIPEKSKCMPNNPQHAVLNPDTVPRFEVSVACNYYAMHSMHRNLRDKAHWIGKRFQFLQAASDANKKLTHNFAWASRDDAFAREK